MAERVRTNPLDAGPLRGTGYQESDDDRSIGQLVKELASESGLLVRHEVDLAKAEMREKLSSFKKDLVSMAIGGALLLAATLLLVEAVNRGLTALLAGYLGLEIAVWLAPLILAAIIGMIGLTMIKKSASSVSDEGIIPDKSVQSLKEDKRWVERKVTS